MILKYPWGCSAPLLGSPLMVRQLCCGHLDGSPGVCIGISCTAGSQVRAGNRGAGCAQGWAFMVISSHSIADKSMWATVFFTSVILDLLLRVHASLGSLPTAVAHPLVPLCSASCCCHFSIFPSSLICCKYQPRNPGICPLCQKKIQFKCSCMIFL